MAAITAPTNSLCRSRLAENWGNVLFLCLLLQGFAFFEPVFDVGDDVAHTRIRVITREQVVDLGDDLVHGHHFRITDGCRPRLLDRLERYPSAGLQRCSCLLTMGDVLEIHCG